MKNIPIHRLEERTDIGLEVRHTSDVVVSNELAAFDIHRDDNYIFIFVNKGCGSVMVDFEEIPLKEGNIYFIAPGQIHYQIRGKDADAWVVLVNPSFIPADCLEILERNLFLQQPYVLSTEQATQCRKMLELLRDQCNSDRQQVFYKQLSYAFLNAFLCIITRVYLQYEVADTNASSRPLQITRAFRKRLRENMKSEKRPSYYAGQLAISEIYLNEAVKGITGFTVSYWIRNEVILEAKRLLCFTQLNIKEIAHALGYEDHTYFSKLFRQTAKMTPLSFREMYLK